VDESLTPSERVARGNKCSRSAAVLSAESVRSAWGQAAGSSPAVTVSALLLVLHASELVWHVLTKKARRWVKEHIRKGVVNMVPSNPSVFAAGAGVAGGVYHLTHAERTATNYKRPMVALKSSPVLAKWQPWQRG
jgi:hypothetical protein